VSHIALTTGLTTTVKYDNATSDHGNLVDVSIPIDGERSIDFDSNSNWAAYSVGCFKMSWFYLAMI